MLTHPRRDVRDTSRHATYRAMAMGKTPSLKRLTKELLGMDIQQGHHSSVEDARATMLLYKREKDAFESEHVGKFGNAKAKSMMDRADGGMASSSGTNGKRKKKGKK